MSCGAKSNKVELPVQADKFVSCGQDKKETWDMTPEDWAVVAEDANTRVRKNAFANNLPVYFEQDGYIWAEYPDGAIVKQKKARFD